MAVQPAIHDVTVTDSPEESTRVDGRRARRDRNLELVIDTVRQLFAEEMLVPSIEAVSRRSGVSVRSLYRYFDDPESLIGAAVERGMQLGRERARIPGFGRGDFGERLDTFVTVRVQLFEHHGAGFRAARHHAPNLPRLRDALEDTRRFLREQVEVQFAPELDAIDRRERYVALASCDVVSQLDSLDYLRRERRHTVAECEAILSRSVRTSLGA